LSAGNTEAFPKLQFWEKPYLKSIIYELPAVVTAKGAKGIEEKSYMQESGPACG
jgi:hypothetical protein